MLNSRPVLSFDGTSNLKASLPFLANSSYTLCTEAQRASTADSQFMLSTNGDGAGTDITLHFGYRNTTDFTLAHWNDDLELTYSSGSPYINIICGRFNSSNRYKTIMLRNETGAVYTSSGTANSALLNSSNATIGSVGSGSFFNGNIAEIVAYNSYLSDDQIASLVNYFRQKYSLP